jgi:ankyrin repeat protein
MYAAQHRERLRIAAAQNRERKKTHKKAVARQAAAPKKQRETLRRLIAAERTEDIRKRLDSGESFLNQTSHHRNTVLHSMARKGKTLRYLWENFPTQFTEELLSATNRNGETARMLASSGGRIVLNEIEKDVLPQARQKSKAASSNPKKRKPVDSFTVNLAITALSSLKKFSKTDPKIGK